MFLDAETTGTDAHDRLCQIAFNSVSILIVNELFYSHNIGLVPVVICKKYLKRLISMAKITS